MSSIYIAHPIDHVDPTTADLIWEAEEAAATAVRSRADLWAYRPGRAFVVGDATPRTPDLTAINNTALHRASRVLVIWPAGSTSWGVPAEVAMAAARGIPVDIVTDTAPGRMGWASQWEESEGVRVHHVETHNLHQPSTYREVLETPPAEADGDTREPLRFLQVRPQERFTLPTRGHDDDAGFDLYVSQDTLVPAGEFVDIPSNTAAQIPDHTWGYLTGRSSTLRKKGLLVNPGVIDAGYRGELFAGVQNMTSEGVLVSAGERVAQLIVLPNGSEPLVPTRVERFETTTARGENGFGSTGS